MSVQSKQKLKIKIESDRKVLKADARDIAYIKLSLVDEFGATACGEHTLIRCYLSGHAKLISYGDQCTPLIASPNTMSCILSESALPLIIEAGVKPEIITLTAIAPGIKPCSLKIRITALKVAGGICQKTDNKSIEIS